jgi:type I restriction enzyme, S subunit
MRARWKETTIGEAVDFFDHKRIPLNSRERIKRKGIYPYYGASGIFDYIDGYLFDGQYLLIAEDGENLNSRKLPIAFLASGRFWVNNHAHIVRGKEGVANDKFLKHFFAATDISGYVTGAAQPKLSQSNLRIIKIALPEISEQRKIAAILSAYDDLIENNTRRIQILEDMARRIYEEWFMRFRFPGHENVRMTESELGLIPDGWGVVRLEDQYKTGSGGTPSRRNPAFYGGNINWVKTQELNDGFIFESDEKITLDGLNNSSAKVFSTETVLVAMYGATIGALGILANPSSTNQACCAIIKRREPFGFEFAFLTLLVNRSKLIELRAGAAQQNINQVVIKNFKMMKPDDGTVSAFNHLANPILKQISILQKKTDILRRTRDLLLPKLISGEIDVSNFPEPVTD